VGCCFWLLLFFLPTRRGATRWNGPFGAHSVEWFRLGTAVPFDVGPMTAGRHGPMGDANVDAGQRRHRMAVRGVESGGATRRGEGREGRCEDQDQLFHGAYRF
jgi:hypothetical protein